MGFKLCEASKVEVVNEFIMWMKEALEEAYAALTKAKDDMAQYYNCQQTPVPCYNIGDYIFLDASDCNESGQSGTLTTTPKGI
jgi:hypothetical protein